MNNEPMKTDTHRIRALREARGWSQEHLAAVAGVSPRTVQRLESDGRASHESRMAVASAFGVEPAQLLEAGGMSPLPAPVANGMSAAERTRITLWIVSIVLAVVMFQMVAGYTLGKDAAQRDNRINQACKADPVNCKR
ncbi:hypothetical protein STPYR_10519 [uncultured Stenotrophomonas sp.]|uniref:HTH cro/C1-type domain-containing protein n=1 Tax=uncultured Stenotrophomonas sp. TaxID=165438 RepID=A0A1Y5Q009_9GAMM|nr:hypothetical protein STPYR_10519 [uncultured Stenotrophomonas sp.]